MSARRKGRAETASAIPRGPVEATPASGPRRTWILSGVVAVVSAALVAGAFVPAPHTGGDNAAYLTLAYSLLQDGSYTELFDPAAPPHTKYPPFFPMLLAALMALGARTWTAFKVVAAASTVAASVLAFLWARGRLGAGWAVGAALLFAASAGVVYYSHWILSDPTFVALTLLALWALERSDEEGAAPGWLVLGVAAAGLAYFTRSAGLPLVVALLGWLALRKRWRAALGAGLALGIPMLLWMLRARGAGQGEYVSEFWLVDPYDPSRGQVGLGGLVGRAWTNTLGYVGNHLPTGILGPGSGAAALLGFVLVALAVGGWVLAARRRLGPSELFLPLYVGLVLLWPAVWSGDRFALPVLPLLFVYGAEALRRGAERAGAGGRRLVPIVGAVAFLTVFLPALGAWTRSAQEASACSAAVRQAGPWACHGPGVAAFVEAAAWAGANLPEGSAVLARKPRIFYVLSGVPSRTFPFTDDPGVHLALGDEVGARYELFDQWDGLAGRWVAPAVGAWPSAFCAVRSFGAEGGTVLLGLTPPAERGDRVAGGDQVSVTGCPTGYVAGTGEAPYASSSSRIPLLERLDP